MPAPTVGYQLPGYLVLLIGLAMLVLWLGLFVVVVGSILSGTPLDVTAIIPAHVDDALRNAMMFQYGVIFLTLLALFIFGNLICVFWLGAAHGMAVVALIWLIRVMLVVMFVQLFASNAIPAAVGGIVAALPGLLTQLPFILVSAGILLFAERTLVHRQTQA